MYLISIDGDVCESEKWRFLKVHTLSTHLQRHTVNEAENTGTLLHYFTLLKKAAVGN